MIGSLDTRHRQATIVGAGIAGLLLAHELDRAGFEVTLIEKSDRAGGLIETIRTEWGIVETAAQSFLAPAKLRELCAELGVALLPVNPGSRARYVLRGGKMRRFPLTPWEALRAFGRAYFVLSRRDVSSGRASMQDWGRRHLGQAAVDYLLAPFLTGIYAARPSEIEVGAAFPRLEIPPGHSLLSLQLHRLRTGERGEKCPILAPEQGMGSLAQALAARLEKKLGPRFRLGESVTTLPEAPNLVLTLPASAAAALLAREEPSLAAALRALPYSPLVSATVFAPARLFPRVPRGVGVLIPASEGRKCLGVLFNSSAFAGRVNRADLVSLTMMLGGTTNPEIATEPADARLGQIRAELHALFGLPADDPEIRIFPTLQERAIPVYGERVLELRELAQAGWCSRPGRLLFGNYTGEISIRGMARTVAALGQGLAAGLQP